MKSLKTILALVLFVLIAASFIFSEELKVRVTASKANIRLRPTTESTIVSAVPLGAVLEVIKKEGNWYFVKLPPDEKGIVVTGYIHQSIVEIIEEIKSPEPKKEMLEEEKNITEEKKEEKPSTTVSEVITSEKKAVDLNYQYRDYKEWKAEYDKTEKEIDLGGKYQMMGIIAMIAGPALTAVGVITKVAIFDVVGAVTALGGIPLYSYGSSKKSQAETRMIRLEQEGKTRKWISFRINPVINPAKKYYALSFTLSF